MAKIAHQHDQKDNASQARENFSQAAGAATAQADRIGRAVTNGSSDATSILEIFADQTRHSFEAATALGRARTLAEAAQVQSNFLGGSFDRFGRLSERYLALLRGGMTMLPSASRR
jgi:hypothetical protein